MIPVSYDDPRSSSELKLLQLSHLKVETIEISECNKQKYLDTIKQINTLSDVQISEIMQQVTITSPIIKSLPSSHDINTEELAKLLIFEEDFLKDSSPMAAALIKSVNVRVEHIEEEKKEHHKVKLKKQEFGIDSKI